MARIELLGVPMDLGAARRGVEMGPSAVRLARLASRLESLGHTVTDAGDVPVPTRETLGVGQGIGYLDTITMVCRDLAGRTRAIVESGGVPVVLGGDHSVNIPCINAFSGEAPIHIVQIDAHLDFVDERHGVRYGHGNPMRRAAEKDYVTGLSQIGIRNVSSTARDGYEAARAMGSDILSVRRFRKLGVEAVLARIPLGKRYYVTIDIDAFDPSIAPGTGTPSHGGFLYYEVLELLDGLTRRGTVVGIDLVEVAPDYDHTGTTAILAAQILMNFIGRILHRRTASD